MLLSESDAGVAVAYMFYPFLWNGANSVFARDNAAKSLAQLLTDGFKHFPQDKFVVIAHSHGGNTALRALHYLGEDAKRVYVITMGTPFLQIYARKRLSPLAFDSTLMAVSVWLVLAYLLERSGVEITPDGWILISLLPFSLLVSELILYFAVNPVNYGYGFRWCNRPSKIADATSYDLRKTPPARLLVLRAFDDEASLALAAGAIATRITNSLLSKNIFIVVALIIMIAAAFALAVFFPKLSNALWRIVAMPWTTMLAVFSFIGLTIFVSGIVPSFFKVVFGRELLVGAARCEVSAESVPDGSDGVDVITLRPESITDWIRSRHAIYDHEACASAINEWILNVADPPLSLYPYPEIDGQDWVEAHSRFLASRNKS